jgi:hypothetical protein
MAPFIDRATPFIDLAPPCIALEFALVAPTLKRKSLLIISGNLFHERCLVSNQQRHGFLKMIIGCVRSSRWHGRLNSLRRLESDLLPDSFGQLLQDDGMLKKNSLNAREPLFNPGECLLTLPFKLQPLLIISGNLFHERCLVLNQQRHGFLKMIIGVRSSRRHDLSLSFPGKVFSPCDVILSQQKS